MSKEKNKRSEKIDLIWSEDKLNDRKNIANSLKNFISTLDSSYILSIDSTYGTGKTFFVEKFKEHLEILEYKTLYYDSWKYDYFNDPLISLIEEIENEFGEKDEIIKSIRKHGLELAKHSLSTFTKYGLKLLPISPIAGEATEQAIEVIKEVLASSSSNPDLNKAKEIENFRKSLEKLVKKLHKEGYKKQFIVFIDELDRCKPTYSIELLEIIKHLFDVENIVFILSINSTQLTKSIKSLYGNEFKADEYLERFFNFSFTLPRLNNISFAKHLYNKNEIEKLETADTKEAFDIFNQFFPVISNYFNLSLREQEKVYSVLNFVIRDSQIYHEIFLTYLSFIVALKFKNVEIYEYLTFYRDKGAMNIHSLFKEKGLEVISFDKINNYEVDWFISTLISNSKKSSFDDLYRMFKNEYNQRSQYPIQGSEPINRINRLNSMIQFLKLYEDVFQGKDITSFIIHYLEFSNNLS